MTELLDRARATLEEGLKYPATMFYVRPGEFSAALRTVLDALSTLPDAVAGEREATVRWLREKATGQDIYRKEVPFRGGWYLSERRSAEYRVLADAIERGDHLAAAIRKEPS